MARIVMLKSGKEIFYDDSARDKWYFEKGYVCVESDDSSKRDIYKLDAVEGICTRADEPSEKPTDEDEKVLNIEVYLKDEHDPRIVQVDTAGAMLYAETRGAGPRNNPKGKKMLVIKGLWEREEIEFEYNQVTEIGIDVRKAAPKK